MQPGRDSCAPAGPGTVPGDELEPPTLLEELYGEHHRGAYGLAHRMLRNHQDAEEAVQEAFLSVWRSRTAFDAARGSRRTWVLSVVRNRALDVLRARKRRPIPDGLGAELHDARCDVAAVAVASVERESARHALESLPPPQRNALELAYFGGFSHTEIAGLLGLPVGTVKGRIRLGLDHLRLANHRSQARPDAILWAQRPEGE